MLLKKLEKKLENLLNNIDDKKDKEKIKEAYNYAKKAHNWQFRKSWDPYITHPLSVWLSLFEKFNDIDLLISWFLHDVVEDCEVEMKDIYDRYWDNIWYIVDSVTKTEKKFLYDDSIIFDDERDKMLYWWMKNIWCILVKLADREHNLSTLSHMPKNKQVKKSFESQAIYLPLMDITWFYNKNNTISKARYNFSIYLKNNNIKTYKELKNNLFNTCFLNFSEDLFNLVYNNSERVVWKINDKKLFDSLVESWWFDNENVNLKRIELSGDWKFLALFLMKWAAIFDLKKWKISFSQSNFIS